MKEGCLASYLRSLVLGVNTPVPLAGGGYRPAINFDNAATTPPLKAVMREVIGFAPWYASIHRGSGYKSILCSDIFEESRTIVKRFVNADDEKDIVIYTKNTTESINLLAYTLAGDVKKDIVICTDMEHLANDLPWQGKFKVVYVAINECGQLSMESLKQLLAKYQGRVRLVAVTGASNVTGYINPIYAIAKLAHDYGTQIFVDGAQLVAHCGVDMKAHDSVHHIDYLAFSAHKMYAPFGGGVLIGPKSAFENCEPVYKGGGIAKLVTRDFIDWDSPPYKEEAGTPNAMAIVAMLAAIKTLDNIGLNVIHDYEHKLISHAIAGLRSIPGIDLYCCAECEQRVSLISFTLQGMHHKILADALSFEAGISVRNGLFCAHPYVQKLLKLTPDDVNYYYNKSNARFPGLVRISLGIYNNHYEVEEMLQVLGCIARNRDYYKQKYSEAGKARTDGSYSKWLSQPRRKLP